VIGGRSRLIILGAAVVSAALGGCGGSGGGGGGRAQTRVVNVPARPQRSTALSAVQQASIPVANLSWLTSFGGFVWVKTDDGFVVRIDPRTNKPDGKVGAFTDQQHYCQGIGAGGGAVWSCSGSKITRIDPERMKIVASIPVGKVSAQGRLVFLDGRLWVITGRDGNQLVGIDAATNRPDPPITLPVTCSDLAPGGDAVWVLCPTANKVIKVDVAHRSIVGTLAVAGPSAGSATATDLWVGSDQGLVRVNANSLKRMVLFQGLNPGYLGDVSVDGDRVWMRIDGPFLYRIDATSNAVAEQITTNGSPGGGSLLPATGSLWTTADDAGNLLRLRTGA
jgi:hypothetical protein